MLRLPGTYIIKSAHLSPCKRYRYSLTRIWDASKQIVCFICLNPSTADAMKDDATVRRCVGFARLWGYGGIVIVNLFAYRATFPRDLILTRDDIIGPENAEAIRIAVLNADRIVLAWGNHGSFQTRATQVVEMLADQGAYLECLGKTKSGMPLHPLRLTKTTKLRAYLEAS